MKIHNPKNRLFQLQLVTIETIVSGLCSMFWVLFQ